MLNQQAFRQVQSLEYAFSARKTDKTSTDPQIPKDVEVEYHMEPPGTEQAIATTHHVLIFQLQDVDQTLQVDERTRSGRLPAGAFFLVSSDANVSYRWETLNEYLKITIRPLFLKRIAIEMGYADADEMTICTTLFAVDPHIQAIARLYHHEIQQDQPEQRSFQALSMLLAIHLLRYYSVSDPQTDPQAQSRLSPKALKTVLDYVQTHLDQSLSLAVLAQQVNMSVNYFAQAFKQCMGQSPHQYVIEQRLNSVKQQLLQTDASIAKIARQTGFADTSHLGKVFRQHTGMSPQQYRNFVR